jgi:hypothetical protein
LTNLILGIRTKLCSVAAAWTTGWFVQMLFIKRASLPFLQMSVLINTTQSFRSRLTLLSSDDHSFDIKLLIPFGGPVYHNP